MLTVIALAVLAFGQLAIGLLLMLEARRTRRLDQRVFSVLTLLVVVWTLAVGILTGVDNRGAGMHKAMYVLVNDIAFVASFLILGLVYLFSIYYPVRRRIGGWQKIVLGSGAIIAVVSPLSSISGRFVVHGLDLTYSYGELAWLVVVYALTTIISIYFEELTAMHRNGSTSLHRQTRTLLLGISLTILHAVVFVVLLPAIFGQSTVFYALGYVAPYYLFVFTGYGLLRQGLFDIRSIVARSLAYLLTLSLASILYVTPTIFLTSSLSHERLHAGTVAMLALLTLVVAYLFQPIKAYFNKITNRFFFRDSYDAQELLNKLNEALLSTIELNAMLDGALGLIAKEMKAEYCAVVLRGQSLEKPRIIKVGAGTFDLSGIRSIHTKYSNDFGSQTVISTRSVGDSAVRHYLEKSNIDILADLSGGHDEQLGHLMFGPKQSGNPYNSQDVRVIGTITSSLVIAIQNALRFEEIQNFNQTLEEKVEEATRKLRRTNDKLRKLDETKDDFISMASHQLRTPLTSVKGYVSMVLDGDGGELTPMQRKLLTQSFISAQRMVYLISDLLNVSRLRTGKFIIESSPVNLAQVVKDEVGQLVETAKSRGVELSFDKPEHFPMLMLDDTKIRQVVMNFLDNAIYYTPRGGTIEVHLKDMPKSVELTVTDTGIGVPRHEQPHLFTKFYRANNAKRARPDGTGLGLFMAKKVVIAQGGALIFKSTEGKGSTFGFTFAKEKLQQSVKASAA